MKHKKMSLFSKIYLSVIAFFLILLVVAAFVLWSFLKTYEATRPDNIAKNFFDESFKAGNIGHLVEQYAPEMLKFENKDSIDREFKENYDLSQLNFFATASFPDGGEQYTVAYNNSEFAGFTLYPDKEEGFGLKTYKLTDVEFTFESNSEVSVLVEKGSRLKINGIDVDASYISETDIEDISYSHMPKNVEGIVYDKYTVSGLIFEPEVTVVSAGGVEDKAEFDNEKDCFAVPTVYSAELQKDHSDYAISAITEYAKYLSNNSEFSHIAPYLDSSSAIYKDVQGVSTTWLLKHKDYRISDEKACDFIKYTNEVFSCKVSLKDTLIDYSNKEYVEVVDVTVYFRYVGGKFLIFDMVNN